MSGTFQDVAQPSLGMAYKVHVAPYTSMGTTTGSLMVSLVPASQYSLVVPLVALKSGRTSRYLWWQEMEARGFGWTMCVALQLCGCCACLLDGGGGWHAVGCGAPCKAGRAHR